MQNTQESAQPNSQPTLAPRPFAALIAGARFLTNIQDTEHFFRLMDAIDGRQNEKNYQRFLRTSTGAKLDAEGVNFADVLADKDMLHAQPEGSLAREYLEFMSAENLQMELLMDAERDADMSLLQLEDSRRAYMESGIALHDIYHVVTGYGRDAIGEACLLAFTAEQFALKGVGLIAHAMAVRERIAQPQMPVLSMIGEAKNMARQARWTPEIDWRECLAIPVEDVRNILQLQRPKTYLEFVNKAVVKDYVEIGNRSAA